MRFLLLFLSVFVLFYSTLGAAERSSQDRASDFVAKFKASKSLPLMDKDGQLHKASPWYGYVQRPFDLGLLRDQRRQYLRFQKLRQCLNVLEFDLLGFLQKHSHLIPVFEKHQAIHHTFLRTVAPRLSRGYQRCVLLGRLKRNGFFKIKNFEGMAIQVEKNHFLGSFLFGKGGKALKVDLQQVFKLAICRDYLPAQLDILSWLDRKLALQISDETSLYLFKRAEKKAVALKEIKGFDRNTPYKSVIFEAAHTGDIRKLKYAMPYWFEFCGYGSSGSDQGERLFAL